MIVRFGYVAMSTHIKNASPSKTMTYAMFRKIPDRPAALRKLERIAGENLHNTLRLLRHNRANGIMLYRFSSKLVPLWGHEQLQDWHPLPALDEPLRELGEFVRKHNMRVSFHPDHFTVLSTPRKDVLDKSVWDLNRHVSMLDRMGLENAFCNIHIGGTYGNKEQAMARFIKHFQALPEALQQRITLENDDKTFNTEETLEAAETLQVPMVLDVHHHSVNPGNQSLENLWPRILKSWEAPSNRAGLPPKIHMSSPRSAKDPRSHADFVEPGEMSAFLELAAKSTPRLDVMIEAKRKDEALFRLVADLSSREEAKPLNEAVIEWKG